MRNDKLTLFILIRPWITIIKLFTAYQSAGASWQNYIAQRNKRSVAFVNAGDCDGVKMDTLGGIKGSWNRCWHGKNAFVIGVRKGYFHGKGVARWCFVWFCALCVFLLVCWGRGREVVIERMGDVLRVLFLQDFLFMCLFGNRKNGKCCSCLIPAGCLFINLFGNIEDRNCYSYFFFCMVNFCLFIWEWKE